MVASYDVVRQDLVGSWVCSEWFVVVQGFSERSCCERRVSRFGSARLRFWSVKMLNLVTCSVSLFIFMEFC